ncbi:MAG: PPOX class F420-dependent oxidoreductase [Acidimicrobiales bacterium]
MATAAELLRPFTNQPTVLLTTYRRNGLPVGTPVNIAVDGGRAFVRTYESSGKFKRLRNNPRVMVAPSTFRGEPTGPTLHARARMLDPVEATAASRQIAHKHPWIHGLVVPLLHRLTRKRTVYLELRPLDE